MTNSDSGGASSDNGYVRYDSPRSDPDEFGRRAVHNSGEDPRLPTEQSAVDRDELASAIAGLSAMSLGNSVQASMEQIAGLTVRAIPGADGAGVTLLEPGRTATIAASTEFVARIDDIQYSKGEGPCITAAATRRTVMSGSLGDSSLWPKFGASARSLGINSVISLPLIVGDEAVGALNVYAYAGNAFDDHAAELGQLFAASAAVAVHNLRVLSRAQRLAGQLQQALENRAVVDQAIGILMSRTGVDPDAALGRLRTVSQRDNVKLVAVAQVIVDEAVRRARARVRQSATGV